MRYREQPEDDDDGDAVLDLSIVGDEEEQHRIELEHNLQDISIQLSLSNPSQASDQEHSVEQSNRQQRLSESSFEIEYPRHNSRPNDVSVFQGQNNRYLDDTQLGQDNDANLYSYRSIEDDADVHYIGNTMSTTAHHASAVTLSAGLGGRSGKRVYAAENSLSGAEYDPDRPLDSVLNGVADDLSMLNMDNTLGRGNRTTRKGRFTQAQVTFDPLIMDNDTSAIEGINRSFNKARHSKQTQEHAISFRPDRDTTLKPKTGVKHIALGVGTAAPPLSGANATGGSSATSGSKFTRLAKSLAREIEASQRWASAPEYEDRSPIKPRRNKQSGQRSPFKDLVNHAPSHRAVPFSLGSNAHPGYAATKTLDAHFNDISKHERSQLKSFCLPDITGLTSAVGSPPRKSRKRRTYSGDGGSERVEVELLKTLTTLQTRLNQLESQNLVSRRRIQELELELEACKLEVKRERTRVMEREEIIVAQQKDFQKRRSAPNKPAREAPDPALERRYDEIVEEKKALESLVSTLRSHLSRLTNELSNQQSQLDELRRLRQGDLQDLRDKIEVVDALRIEVEQLGGEVEILRGVVEEGLNERRLAKNSMDSRSVDDVPAFKAPRASAEEGILRTGSNKFTNDQSQAEFPSPPPCRPQSRQKGCHYVNDRAEPPRVNLAGPSRLGAPVKGRLSEGDKLRRTSADGEECFPAKFGSYQPQNLDGSRVETIHKEDRQEVGRAEFYQPRTIRGDGRLRARRAHEEPPMFSSRVEQASPQPATTQVEAETPFPQIRGEHLERLFFSAPAHNVRTCRVCHRHLRPDASEDELDFPSWLPPRKRVKTGREDNNPRRRDPEAKENEIPDDHITTNKRANVTTKAPFSEDRLPPQTVLARVLRELEDDFTHYKGIYIELADQYKIMDAASNAPKRNVLAEHLKDVINTLEQKGDQIASLYDLLTFKDKPVKDSVVPERKHALRPSRSPRRIRQGGARQDQGLRKYPVCS